MLLYDEAMETLFLETFGPLVIALLLLSMVWSGRRLLHQLRNRMTPEEVQAARDAFRKRLVHPDAAGVEEVLGAFLPEMLLTLYRDHPTVITEQLEIRRLGDESKEASEWIEAFLPLDAETHKLTAGALKPEWGKGFCFATDGSGNFYWVAANVERQRDAPVFFVAQHPPSSEHVAGSLEEFLSWPRVLHDDESDSSNG